MNIVLIHKAINIAARSFDWVLKNKQILLIILVGSALFSALEMGILFFYPDLGNGFFSISSKIAILLLQLFVLFYAKNIFEGKHESMHAIVGQMLKRFLHIVPALIAVILLGNISSSYFITQGGIASSIVDGALFIFYTLALYLLSVTVMHHGSFTGAMHHWLNRIPTIAPAALIGRFMFFVFVTIIGLISVMLGVSLFSLTGFLGSNGSLIVKSSLFAFITLIATSIFASIIFAAEAYFLAQLGWFSIHNRFAESENAHR